MIRASIISGELEAGEIYSASMLAEQLGVSQTPVREAMLDLAGAGLVEVARNRGFRVVQMSERDLDEISSLRLMLEVPAMALVAELKPDERLAPFEALLEEIEQTGREGDVVGFLTADRDFHLGLLELAGNQRLVRMVAQLRDQTRLIGLQGLVRTGGLIASAREHRPILEALQAGDSESAQEYMRIHLHHTRGLWAGRPEKVQGPPSASQAAPTYHPSGTDD